MTRWQGVAGMAFAMVVAGVAAAAVAQAAPSLELDPSSAASGDSVRATGAGFQASGSVALYLDAVVPGEELATTPMGSRGTFSATFTVPRVGPGTHTVIACREPDGRGGCREQAATALQVVQESSSTTTTTTVPATTTTTRPPSTSSTTSPTTTPGSIGVATTTTSIEGPGQIGVSTTVGPDPPFDATPDDVGVETTTTLLDEQTNVPPGDFPDLSIRAIEVTQGVQSFASSMPLVAGRRTWVRVHVDTDPPQEWGPIDGLLQLERSGLPDLVMVPENGPIFSGKDRTELNSALNYLLPDEYLDAGSLTISTVAWAFASNSLTDTEPDPANNYEARTVTFHEGDDPPVTLIALDDGAGPGPDINSLDVLLGFALVVNNDVKDFHPVKAASFDAYADVLGPGPEAAVPGVWDLTQGTGRHEPNIRMSLVAEVADLFDQGSVMGRFDASIPSEGYTGWASYGVSWNKPVAGTPAHELGHTRGLSHVACKDDDGNGVPDELAGGGLDPTHPNALPPQCSLAPINPTGYFGFTTYRTPIKIYSNDPTHPQAAYPFMSYKSPGWTDPYHWCTLLNAYGIPCSHAAIGVPPKQIKPGADCEPEPVMPGGFQLDLCVLDQLPPDEDPGPPAPGGGGSQGTPAPAEGPLFGIAGFEAGDDAPLVLPQESDGYLLVSGGVDLAARTGSLGQLVRLADVTSFAKAHFAAVVRRVAASGAAPVLARLRGADRQTLAVAPIEVDGSGHGDGRPAGDSSGFFQAMPWIDGTASIELLVDGAVVSSVEASQHPPEVSAVTVDAAGSETVITWDASDADGDALTTVVLWSNDGERWIPVTQGVTDGQVAVPRTDRFPGGNAVRVRVHVGDGVHSALAESDTFEAPTHDPWIGIAGFESGAAIERHELLEVAIAMLDPEDVRLSEITAEWTSDLDGDLGEGPVLATRDLTIGRHRITAAVRGSDGAVASAAIDVNVIERTTPTRYVEEPDPLATRLLQDEGLASASRPDPDSGGGGWALVAVLIALVASAAVGGVAWRRKRQSPASPD